eukprot:7086015-Prymnesium_polylepis.1
MAAGRPWPGAPLFSWPTAPAGSGQGGPGLRYLHCVRRESGLNFQSGSPRLPVIEFGSQGQI